MKKKVDLALLKDHAVSIRSHPSPPLFVDAERETFSAFSFYIIILILSFFLRSVCLLRAATPMESQSTGQQPIIRKENGMNRKASFHWEMPKYGHIMDTGRGRRMQRHKLACCWPWYSLVPVWITQDDGRQTLHSPHRFLAAASMHRQTEVRHVPMATDAQTRWLTTVCWGIEGYGMLSRSVKHSVFFFSKT